MRAFLQKGQSIQQKENYSIMQSVVIEGTLRTEVGKKATKAVRNEGNIPCNVYGGKENVYFSAPEKVFKSLIYTPDFKLAEINVGGNTYKAIVKEIQEHPVTDRILHIDFVELVPGKSLKADIPIILEGQSEGTKKGGALYQKMRRAKVKTTPEKLIDAIKVDVTPLEMGQSIRIRDIEAIDGVEILTSPGTPIASVEIPRALRSATSKEETEAAGEEVAAEAETE